MTLFPLLHWLLHTALVPETAHAQLAPVVNTVGSGLFTSFSGAGWSGGIPGIAGGVVAAIWTIVLPTGVFLVVRAGMSLIVSQDEGKLATAKRTITSTLMGIMLIYISQELVLGFYGNGTTGGLTGGGQVTLQTTIYGIVDWFLVMMAALGALIIVVSVIRAISSFGKEDTLTDVRQTIFGVASGILMISLLPAIKGTLGIIDLVAVDESAGSRADPLYIVTVGSQIVGEFLLFLAIIAIAVVIYAGIRMIVNLGSEDEYKKSKDLIIRALIGLIVIFISYTAIFFLVDVITGNAAIT